MQADSIVDYLNEIKMRGQTTVVVVAVGHCYYHGSRSHDMKNGKVWYVKKVADLYCHVIRLLLVRGHVGMPTGGHDSHFAKAGAAHDRLPDHGLPGVGVHEALALLVALRGQN